MPDSRFEKYLQVLPVGWEKLLSSGLSWYIKNQEPEWVELNVYNDGYAIEVKTDEESVKELEEFWVEHVSPKLGDIDE